MNNNIVAEVSQGKESFMKIQKDIQRAVDQTIPDISNSINRTGESLKGVANNISSILDKISYDIDRRYIPKVDEASTHINQYSPYR